MIEWIKKLFGKEEGVPLDDKVYMPPVETKENGVSEPVLSFVECVRENPKRFDVDSIVSDTYCSYYDKGSSIDYRLYRIWDKQVKRGWLLRGERFLSPFEFYNPSEKRFYEDTFFLTNEEKLFVVEEITKIMGYRKGRKERLEQIRHERRVRDRRNNLKEIYCK